MTRCGRKEFGRVYANDVLWRTNVVNVLDERPDPEVRSLLMMEETDRGSRELLADLDTPFVSVPGNHESRNSGTTTRHRR